MNEEKSKKSEKADKSSEISGGRVGIGIAVVLAVFLVGWLVLRGDDDSSSEPAAEGVPAITTADDLADLASSRGTPIYWAGRQDGAELEVTETNGGENVFVRYLTDGAEAGAESSEFLTVGTYAFPEAVNALEEKADEPGGVLASAPGDATVFFNRKRPQSIYLAYPGLDLQIEVYDPDARRALELVSSGQIVPVS
jgi:hypothetical protein